MNEWMNKWTFVGAKSYLVGWAGGWPMGFLWQHFTSPIHHFGAWYVGAEGFRLGLGLKLDSHVYWKVLELCEEFVPGEVPEYFFDKNPENFPAILDMYRGVQHVIMMLNTGFWLVNWSIWPLIGYLITCDFRTSTFHTTESGCALGISVDNGATWIVKP